MKLDKILEQALNMLFFFFGGKLKGYRTVIVNTITAILGLTTIVLNQDTYDWLCSVNVTLFCDFENSKIFGIILIVVGLLNNILRYFTEKYVVQEYSYGTAIAPIRLNVRSKLRTIMILSAVGIVFILLKIII